MELTVEKIVAGSKELDRRKAVMLNFLAMISQAITAMYREPIAGTQDTSLTTYWCNLELATRTLVIHVMTNPGRHRYGLRVMRLNADGTSLHEAAFHDGNVGAYNLSLSHTVEFWNRREELLCSAIEKFPKIREGLEKFATFAPGQ